MPEKSGPCLPWCFQYNRSQYILIGILIAVIIFLLVTFFYKSKKKEQQTII
jgi:Mg2+ and Co2+ transporter CorA